MKRIDVHVHIVGNGSSGSGCWFRLTPWQRLRARFMLHHGGLPQSALDGDLDQIYVEHLLNNVRQSSLDAVVILGSDQVYDEHGQLMEDVGTIYVPNDYILELGRRYPEFLPAVSIHPARPDALEELDRCVAEGAVMMKCLPNCHNIDCNNPRYQRFWERMAELQLPLLAHTGDEHTLEVVRPDLNTPKTLELPLKCGVSVIAAHCGAQATPFDTNYFPVFLEMLERYPNFYGDLSAFNVPSRGKIIPQCLQFPVASRMIHGSDYPIPVHGHWNWMRGLMDWEAVKRWQACPNLLERDYQYKRAMGFPDITFHRVCHLFPPSEHTH